MPVTELATNLGGVCIMNQRTQAASRELVSKPAHFPSDHSAWQFADYHTGQLMYPSSQSPDQRTRQPWSQTTCQPINPPNRTANQQTSNKTNQATSEPTSRQAYKPARQSARQPDNEQVSGKQLTCLTDSTLTSHTRKHFGSQCVSLPCSVTAWYLVNQPGSKHE